MRVSNMFSASYEVDISPGWPTENEREITFLADDLLGMHTAEFQSIRFYPKSGGSWIGRFEQGAIEKYEDLILAAPEPNHACVISCGAGFWVDVENRSATRLKCLPITGAYASVKHELILVLTWRDCYAYYSERLAWALRNVVLDRLIVKEISDDFAVLSGFNGDQVEIKVNLVDGSLF